MAASGDVTSSVHLEIPIRIGGLGKGDRLVLNRLQFSPDLELIGQIGWITDTMIHDVTVDGAAWLGLAPSVH
jgi:hypothetical protein